MSREFLVYWIPDQIATALDEGDLPHAAGGQLKKVAVGDRLWIVGRREHDPELFVIGYLDVARKLVQKAAQAEMERRYPGYIVWDARWHVLAAEGKELPTKAVSLTTLYPSLRFDSKLSPKLTISNGHPNAQQLQAIRRLTPKSGEAMLSLWSGRLLKTHNLINTKQTTIVTVPDPGVLDLDALDAQRTALVRLEQQATRALICGSGDTVVCAFCSRPLPAALVVAAHIKPRTNCSDEEKKAIGVNVLALCKLGCDDLFERGFLEVLAGQLIHGPAKPTTQAVASAQRKVVGNHVRGWTKEHEKNFKWRRVHRAKWWG